MASIFRPRLLDGKTAFVTGGSSGIGLRIAERLSEHGARVTLAGRNQDKLDSAKASIEATGGVVSAVAMDVRDYTAVQQAIALARAEFGPIDIVVAAAAGNFPAPALGMSANGFKAVIDIDLPGTFNTLRAAHEHLTRPGATVLAISAAHATTDCLPVTRSACRSELPQPVAITVPICPGRITRVTLAVWEFYGQVTNARQLPVRWTSCSESGRRDSSPNQGWSAFCSHAAVSFAIISVQFARTVVTGAHVNGTIG